MHQLGFLVTISAVALDYYKTIRDLVAISETKLAWSVAASELARVVIHAPRTTETKRCAAGRVVPALASTSLPTDHTHIITVKHRQIQPPAESYTEVYM